MKNPALLGRRASRPTSTQVDLPIYDDADTMWADFQNGELDCSQVPPDQVPAITAGREVKDGAWTARSWPAAASTSSA